MGDGKGKKELLDLDDPLRGAEEAIKDSGIVATPTVKPPPDALPAMRERQMTLMDDDLTEQARLASVLMDSTPPPEAKGVDAIRARLAPLRRVPIAAKTIDQLDQAMRDPKTMFVLGFVDGVLPLETIIEVTALPEIETLEILDRLLKSGAIVLP